MNIWFTADTHFRHSNIIRYCNRPFSCAEEHDQVLIDNWNGVVKKNDQIYHLGDVAFGSPESCLEIIGRLNGRIFLLKGNHDTNLRREYLNRFDSVKDIQRIKINVNNRGYKFILCHYCLRTWPGILPEGLASNRIPVAHIHGHSHGTLAPMRGTLDVGVDMWNFTPISLEQVIEYFKEYLKIG